ncbi:MAG TPA: ABC transporter permease [Smithellaceae bacterium]|jgi:putative ABC transport system permease protein|nr:ABC transporter permease [Smithellaceae bacterium]HOF77801.1 ABC transporter permease [Smithellaceae bacterium]HOM70351.1 ABC transporter permease [Smithellaceae bacterium]HOS09352.1 ABC transporter permease [Smithellaceae bacterium]HOU04469.1 ABC transporter permease [Smithellaceae bacterium]
MISIPSTFKISLRALRVNKMRSALTMLGIIIGVGAVITMIAVGKGTSEQVSKQIATVGSNMIIVLPGSTTAGGVRGGMGTQMTLTRDDAEAIERECSAVLYAAPILSGVAQIVYGNQNWATSVQGTATNMLAVRDLSLTAGRNFTDQDIRNSTKVCILGQTVVNMLFGGMEPINQTVRIKKVPFMVIGVLESKGQSVIGRDQDDVIYIPLTTAQKRIFGTTFPGMVHTIAVKARSAEDLSRAEEQITQLLRQRHRIGPKQEDDFSVRNLTQMLELAQQAAKAMALLLAAIASISLLVGGIGIMNIMLVSVTERTREIGIRMAVGAKTWDIRLQFIIEAITLSLIGGMIGIILGIIASQLLSYFAGLTTIISPLAVILAVGFSGLVGVFFGFYPAYKASLLNPIDALRYE